MCLGSSPNQMQWHGLFVIATGMLSFKFAVSARKELGEVKEDVARFKVGEEHTWVTKNY